MSLTGTWNSAMNAEADVPISWLLANLNDSVDWDLLQSEEDWLGLISYKRQDFLDYSYDQGWLDSIEEDGVLKPVAIIVNYNGRYGHKPLPDKRGLTFTLGNGHHRLVAALLLAHDSIPCYFVFDDDIMHTEVTDSAELPSCY